MQRPNVVALAMTAVAMFIAGIEAAQQAAPRSQTPAAAPAAPSMAGNADNGKKLFAKYGCYECHGREAQGGGVAGPRLGPSPMSYPAFVRYVRAPKGEMPPYTDKLITSERDLSDIHAFLASRPAPPPVTVLPQR